MAKDFLLREQEGRLSYDQLEIVKPEALKALGNGIRIRIIKLLAQEPMYPAELAKRLRMHEQKVYYHIQQLIKAGILEVVEKKEIRGTTARKYMPRQLNFGVSFDFKGKNMDELRSEARNPLLDQFLSPFISQGMLDTKIVVGSPDPHGPFKARARDGHYAIDLALFLGSMAVVPRGFVTSLDVDAPARGNMIIVGGPVTNLAMAKVNESLPAKFSDKKPWGVIGKNTYTDDNVGLIARIPSPSSPEHSLLLIAGIRYSGTKAAVLALTRFHKLALSRFTGQKEFYCIVQGFDLDGDGKVDSVELLE
jgi:DNA-binding transcriptional ArsR family regulator